MPTLATNRERDIVNSSPLSFLTLRVLHPPNALLQLPNTHHQRLKLIPHTRPPPCFTARRTPALAYNQPSSHSEQKPLSEEIGTILDRARLGERADVSCGRWLAEKPNA